LLSITVGILAAYSLTKLRYPGRDFIRGAVLFPYLIPRSILFLPLFKVVKFLGVYDSIAALIITYPTFTVSFCTWLLIGYFRTIPNEIEECARVDGCTRLGAFIRVGLPLAIPGVIAAFLFSFTLTWTEFIYALTFISRSEAKTIPVGVSLFQAGDLLLWGQLMASAALASFPIIILYSFFQRHFMRGLTAGAVKG
jgi:multiple sugar transport system permease protein